MCRVRNFLLIVLCGTAFLCFGMSDDSQSSTKPSSGSEETLTFRREGSNVSVWVNGFLKCRDVNECNLSKLLDQVVGRSLQMASPPPQQRPLTSKAKEIDKLMQMGSSS